MQDLLGRGYLNLYSQAQAEGRWNKRKIPSSCGKMFYKLDLLNKVLCSVKEVMIIALITGLSIKFILFYRFNDVSELFYKICKKIAKKTSTDSEFL